MDQLQVVGNVLTKNSSRHEFENGEEDDVEYFDEFRDVGSLKIFCSLHYRIAGYFLAILALFIILGTFALALESINENVYLIRRFGSDRSPHQ